jgi:predicted nucleic acid-binding protein
MERIITDTSAFLALLIETELLHKKVVEKHNEYLKINAHFYTTKFVLSELYTRLIYDYSQRECKNAIKLINANRNGFRLSILDIEDTLFKKAENALLKFAEHKLSFTDATIYTCMREFKLDEVFTLDDDFKKIGLKTSF